jgi:hypothetical protein
MAVTPALFVTNYPEFAQAQTSNPALVQSALDDAYALTPASVWPAAIIDQGAQLRAAQTLALSPFGRGMALANEEGKTVYDQRLDRLIAIVAAGGSLS